MILGAEPVLTITSRSGTSVTIGTQQSTIIIGVAACASSGHIRDPKVFYHGSAYYMALGARDKESKGMVLLYRSENLKDWEYYTM